MQDPLSGTRAAADFITEMMQTREGEHSQVEKAEGDSDKALSADGQKLYDMCVAGFEQAGVEGENPTKVCRAYAQDFDRKHPGGFDEVLDAEGDEPEVEKTVSTAGMSASMGSPSAEVHLTDAPRKRRLGPNS